MTQNSGNHEIPVSPVRKSWLRRNALALAMFGLMLGLTIALFIFKKELMRLGNYGYLGTFFLSMFTNATIILPMPSILMIIPLGATFNPLLIGIVAGFGGAIGEMTAYVAGYSGRTIWRDNQAYQKAVGWLKKWGMLIVFVFAVTPMPVDVMGLAAGNLRLPAWKYFLPCALGKIIKYIFMAYLGYWGWEAFSKNENLQTLLLVCGIALIGTSIIFGLALSLENWDWKRTRK